MTFSQNSQKYSAKLFAIFLIGIFFGAFFVFLGFKTSFFTNIIPSESEKTAVSTSFSQNTDTVKNSENTTISEKNLLQNTIFSSKKLKNVYEIVNDNFYGLEKKTEKELEDGLVSALIQSLGDKYSDYFTPEQAEEFRSDLQGSFEGIGAIVGESDFGVIIDKVLPNAPAEKAGLRALDVITNVNGTSIKGMKVSEAVKLMRGKKGTKVMVSYLRDSVPATVEVTRDAVILPSVDGKMLENSEIGYIQINSFAEQTPWEFRDTIRTLREKWAKGLILDFRYNGGGYLGSAQAMMGEFLPQNSKVVITKENNAINNSVLSTSFLSLPDTKIPVVVLVNEYSASASEIVAGAFQDYGRAILVGNTTYGKGSVQEMFSLNDGSMVKLTIAKWYTPNDKNIDGEGITPDILVNMSVEDYRKTFDRQKKVSEKILQEMINGKSIDEVKEWFKNNSESILNVQ